MNIEYSSEIKGDYLSIVTCGSLFSTESVLAYFKKVREDLVRVELNKLLIDETKCHVHMSLSELNNVVREVRKIDDSFDMIKLSIVCSGMNFPLYQHLCESKDYCMVFTDIEKAKEWLKQV